MPFYILALAPCLCALAILVIAIRADKKDLPEITRAIMGRKDDGDGPPPLPGS